MTSFIRRLLDSPSTYPITTYFLGAMGILFAKSTGWINLPTAFVTLGFLALLLILVAFRQDLKVVHALVNSQHDDLVARVQQLTDALVDSNTEVPREPKR